MTRRRRLLDRLLAVALAVVVALVGAMVYHLSDIRNANLVTGTAHPAPATPTELPPALGQKWSAPTDPAVGAVASASGVVVTTDLHAVTGRDAVTGAVRWTYSRANRSLCAVGSSDIGPANMGSSSSVAGITAVYDENGFCSQVMTFDPVTGARGKVRTSSNEQNGSLVFGGPYAGWLGADRLEVWRFDLVRTIQYGIQINPTKPGQSRLGCTFTDMALAATQFATVEHCPAEGGNARLVVNFDDPGAVSGHPKDWDVFQHSARVDIDTGAVAARIVGITGDRVAVLVSGPKPAVVVYDAAGKQASRTPVDIPAADIRLADSVTKPAIVTPAAQTSTERYSLVGFHVVAISMPTAQVPPPATALSSVTASSTSSIVNALNPTSVAPTVEVTDLKLDWVAAGALGLPATVASTVLLPTAKGLLSFDSAAGPTATPRTLAVNRGGYTGRVDVSAVGSMLIEDRGSSVVGLG